MSNKFLFFPIFGIALPVVLYFIFSDIRQVFEIVVPPVGDVAIETDPTRTVSIEKKSEKIVFVGDVLLARHVEFLLDTKPEFNPFKEVGAIFLDAPHVIGNFESAILESHKQTPSYVTIFSVDQKYLPRLREAGFTHLSLANNHSFDYGAETFSYTTKALKNTGLVPFGHPNLVATTSATFFTSGDYTIGLLAINQIFTPMSLTDITTQLKALSLVSDYKIAYVHWGRSEERRGGKEC